MAFLFMDMMGGAGTASVLRYVQGTPTQVGNTFDTIPSGGPESSGRNRVIQLLGELYAMSSSGVYKKDDPTSMTGNWSSDFAFAAQDAANAQRATGLHLVYIGDVPHLTGVYPSNVSQSQWRGIRYNFGTASWDQTAATAGPNVLHHVDDIMYRGVLHWFGFDIGWNVNAGTWDPAAQAFGSVANPFIASVAPTMAIGPGDRLFAVYNTATASTGSIELAEFTGGTWVNVAQLAASGSIGSSIPGRPGREGLFRDGSNLIAIVRANDGGQGWKAFRIDAALSVVEITTTVVPVSLRTPNDGGPGVGTDAQRFTFVVDNDTAPGTPGFLGYHSVGGSEGTAFTVYQWNGIGSLMTQVDTGGDAFHAICGDQSFSGGNRIWTAAELDSLISGRADTAGGETLTLRFSGGGTGRRAQIYFSKDGGHTLTQATLLAASVTGGAATQNGNDIENIASDGLTDYGVGIDFSGSGIVADVDRVQYYPRILVS